MNLVQFNPTTIINMDTVTYVSKLSDNKLSIHFNSGNSMYLHISIDQFWNKVNNRVGELLTEDYVGNL